MATVSHKLTVAEFEARYGGEKPYYEFWFGEAVQKSMPTWIHGLLQRFVMNLLSEAGYEAGAEVRLNIDPEFQPIPDVIATKERIELPYPTKAVEIVVEILSNDDSMSRVLTKRRKYREWGFEQIYVMDPGEKLLFRWVEHRLEETDLLAGLAIAKVWAEMDARIGS